MTHYHEVYFNAHTNDGPRVGATRRTRAEIERERRADRNPWPGAAIVRCDRADDQCPWTVDGVPRVVEDARGMTDEEDAAFEASLHDQLSDDDRPSLRPRTPNDHGSYGRTAGES
jgi:hypothetical protein